MCLFLILLFAYVSISANEKAGKPARDEMQLMHNKANLVFSLPEFATGTAVHREVTTRAQMARDIFNPG